MNLSVGSEGQRELKEYSVAGLGRLRGENVKRDARVSSDLVLLVHSGHGAGMRIVEEGDEKTVVYRTRMAFGRGIGGAHERVSSGRRFQGELSLPIEKSPKESADSLGPQRSVLRSRLIAQETAVGSGSSPIFKRGEKRNRFSVTWERFPVESSELAGCSLQNALHPLKGVEERKLGLEGKIQIPKTTGRGKGSRSAGSMP